MANYLASIPSPVERMQECMTFGLYILAFCQNAGWVYIPYISGIQTECCTNTTKIMVGLKSFIWSKASV